MLPRSIAITDDGGQALAVFGPKPLGFTARDQQRACIEPREKGTGGWPHVGMMQALLYRFARRFGRSGL